jgi:hypothetical protein
MSFNPLRLRALALNKKPRIQALTISSASQAVTKENNHVAPMGLERIGLADSINIPPRWGCFVQG